MKIQLLAFDLDGTLAKSKSPLDDEMCELLSEILEKIKVSVISGGNFPQFEKQIISRLENYKPNFNNLLLLPTSGAKFYIYKNNLWEKLYSLDFSEDEKKRIFEAFDKALNETNFKPEKVYGEIVEDRDTQITFSAIGQQAPVEEKEKWDPDLKKRMVIKKVLEKLIPEFTINIGGATSVDVLQKGIDKGFAMKKLLDFVQIPVENSVFVGDKLVEGGNDLPALKSGVKGIAVNTEEDTKVILKKLIKNNFEIEDDYNFVVLN